MVNQLKYRSQKTHTQKNIPIAASKKKIHHSFMYQY